MVHILNWPSKGLPYSKKARVQNLHEGQSLGFRVMYELCLIKSLCSVRLKTSLQRYGSGLYQATEFETAQTRIFRARGF